MQKSTHCGISRRMLEEGRGKGIVGGGARATPGGRISLRGAFLGAWSFIGRAGEADSFPSSWDRPSNIEDDAASTGSNAVSSREASPSRDYRPQHARYEPLLLPPSLEYPYSHHFPLKKVILGTALRPPHPARHADELHGHAATQSRHHVLGIRRVRLPILLLCPTTPSQPSS